MPDTQRLGRSWLLAAIALVAALFPGRAQAQLAPGMGYVFPCGGQAGTTVDVVIGGYDWTGDMQVFVHDPRVRLEIVGPPGPVLVPEPPYWFGSRARLEGFPLPREIPARLTIAADCPPGPVLWQAANANGVTGRGVLWVGTEPEVRELPRRNGPQPLRALPVAVHGQIGRIEQIDRYTLTAAADGLVYGELLAQRLRCSKLQGLVQVRDGGGRLLVDVADTVGRDLTFAFAVRAGETYTIAVHDGDFAGDRSFVYRLLLAPSPRVVASLPAAGQRGSQRPVALIGYGLATGQPRLEEVSVDVAFPADANLRAVQGQLSTAGNAAYSIPLSDVAELTESTGNDRRLSVPAAVSGRFGPQGSATYTVALTKGEVWTISAAASELYSPLDLAISLRNEQGQELAQADDLPGTIQPRLEFTVPADGVYRLDVVDRSGEPASLAAVYRLVVERAAPGFQIAIPELLPVLQEAKATLPVTVARTGGFTGPITVRLENLPAALSVPAELVVAEGAAALNVEVTCSGSEAATASRVRVVARAEIAGQRVERDAQCVMAAVIPPVLKLTPEGLDDVRRVARGSTFPAPVLIERLRGFSGEFVLEQTARQQRTRMGMTGPDLVVSADAVRVEYPIFCPEWLETTRTSRMILNGVAKVPDAKGNVRHLVQKMDLRIGILPAGAMLKIAHTAGELKVPTGAEFEVPVSITRTGELTEGLKLEVLLPDELSGAYTTDLVLLGPDQSQATLRLRPTAQPAAAGEYEVKVRATALQRGFLPVVAESSVELQLTSP